MEIKWKETSNNIAALKTENDNNDNNNNNDNNQAPRLNKEQRLNSLSPTTSQNGSSGNFELFADINSGVGIENELQMGIAGIGMTSEGDIDKQELQDSESSGSELYHVYVDSYPIQTRGNKNTNDVAVPVLVTPDLTTSITPNGNDVCVANSKGPQQKLFEE